MLTIGASHRTASSSLLAEYGRAAEAFRDRALEARRSAEVERWPSGRDPASVRSRQELDLLTRSIVDKLLHGPMRGMRAEAPSRPPSRPMLRAARELVSATLRHRLPAG